MSPTRTLRLRRIATNYRHAWQTAFLALTAVTIGASTASAQVFSQRGFVDARGVVYAEKALNDPEQYVGDALIREDAFVNAAGWLELAAGIDGRANSHGQVEDAWRFDWQDRGVLRPRFALRRLSTTLRFGWFSVTAGKQFIRWARADILNPEDRFAPRDYMNVIDTELLPVFAVRPSIQFGPETVDLVYSPRFTPARLPLINQRWTVPPPEASGLVLTDRGSVFPTRSQQGVRWSHAGGLFEMALSYFDGYNYLPSFAVRPVGPAAADLTRVYPRLRTFGGDLAIPTRIATLKGEAAYYTSPNGQTDEYVLYVVEIERQHGEWVFDGGYVGEVGTRTAVGQHAFSPDEGVAKSILGRASYTVDPRRTVTIEGAVRQSGDGFYLKGEFSEAFGQHWRLTFAGVGLGGNSSDFLGQYRRNSNGSVALRFSF